MHLLHSRQFRRLVPTAHIWTKSVPRTMLRSLVLHRAGPVRSCNRATNAGEALVERNGACFPLSDLVYSLCTQVFYR